jgi:hypothetical protein
MDRTFSDTWLDGVISTVALWVGGTFLGCILVAVAVAVVWDAWQRRAPEPVRKPREVIPEAERCSVTHPRCTNRGTHPVHGWLLCDDHHASMLLGRRGGAA